MSEAFIIMHIGDPGLDRMCEEVLVPALQECDMEARRVDKHNQGGLLKSEIVQLIEDSDFIIADLTNERPNCYLEVGYAMGIDKFQRLILTVREDHLPDSPNFDPNGPKVHFDLAGYDLLIWSPEDLAGFREELVKRIKRRSAVLRPGAGVNLASWDEEWISGHKETATLGMEGLEYNGVFELQLSLVDRGGHWSQNELKSAARNACIETFGWPIAVYLDLPECKPRPRADGISAEVAIRDGDYDYWALRKNGDFYLRKNIFEDQRNPEMVFFDTRIIRVAESLLYAVRLYSGLGVDLGEQVRIRVLHSGLKGRHLGAASQRRCLRPQGPAEENEASTEFVAALDKIGNNLSDFVNQICQDVFVLFDFADIDRTVLNQLVDNFVNGVI